MGPCQLRSAVHSQQASHEAAQSLAGPAADIPPRQAGGREYGRHRPCRVSRASSRSGASSRCACGLLQAKAQITRRSGRSAQSPFTGKYETLDNGQPLLYARCTRLEDLAQVCCTPGQRRPDRRCTSAGTRQLLLQAPAAPAAALPLTDTPGQPSARKKRRLDMAALAAAKPSSADKAEQPKARLPEDYNNKEQALGIRSVLGSPCCVPAVLVSTASVCRT